MALSSQNSLNSLSISTLNCSSQADYDGMWAGVVASYNAKLAGTYTSPASMIPPRDPSQVYNDAAIEAHWAAVAAMQAAAAAGAIDLCHSDCDNANKVISDEPIVSCPLPDLQILANQVTGWTGTVARAVLSGAITALNDMDAAGKIITADLAATQAPPPTPADTPVVYMSLPGPIPGMVIGQVIKAADGTFWAYSFLPFGPNNMTYRLVRVPPTA